MKFQQWFERAVIGIATGLMTVLLFMGLAVSHAQSTGYRWGPQGLIYSGLSGTCYESTYNAGPDACITRSGVGHISVTNGVLAANPDYAGTKTLSSGAGTVTFANAFTAAPLVFCQDETATAAKVRCFDDRDDYRGDF